MLKNTRKMLGWSSVMLTLSLGIFVIDRVGGCSPKKEIVDRPVVIEAPKPTCDNVPIGDVRESTCDTGGTQKEICTSAGWSLFQPCPVPTPPPPDDECVAFETVRPAFQEYCSVCHKLAEYETAKNWAAKVATRIGLDPADPRHMPPTSQEQLPDELKTRISTWILAGAQEKCQGDTPPPPPKAFLDFGYIEASIFRSAANQEDARKQRTRWLVATHKYNEEGPEAVKLWKSAAEKALNSLVSTRTKLIELKAADEKDTIWYFDLNDADFDKKDWNLIEQKAELPIVSETDIGKALRALVGTDSPWVHVESFIDTAHKNAEVYYELTRTPNTSAALLADLGADFKGDLRDLDALFVGTNRSPIALQKNRLIVRINSNAGAWYETFDTVDDGVPQRNLLEFPLLADTGSKKNFKAVASEVIYTLPNGLHGYALFNDRGIRQNAAPLNVVADNRSPINPEIKVGISCHRCHSAGILPSTDIVRDHVTRNAAQFLRADVDRVLALYRNNSKVAEQFNSDNLVFTAALDKQSIDSSVDPINLVEDEHLSEYNAAKLAQYLFLTEADFLSLLNQSPTAQAQLGALLTGNTITYGQLRDAFATIVADMGLFQERLGQ